MLKGAEAMSSSTMSCSRGIHQSFGRYPFSLSINELSLASDITAHPWPSTRIFPWYNFVNTSVSLGAEIAYSMDAIRARRQGGVEATCSTSSTNQHYPLLLRLIRVLFQIADNVAVRHVWQYQQSSGQPRHIHEDSRQATKMSLQIGNGTHCTTHLKEVTSTV